MTKVGGKHVWHPGGVKGGAETQAAALGICPRVGLLTKWMENGEMLLLWLSIKRDNIFWLWSFLLRANFSSWMSIRYTHRSWNLTNMLISWRRVCQRTLWCPALKTKWKPWDTWWAVVHLISHLLESHFWPPKSIYPPLIKLPVITNLRELCVDKERWKTLETALGKSLDVETLSLSVLEETDIISHAAKIQEVRNQLSKARFWPLNTSCSSQLKVKRHIETLSTLSCVFTHTSLPFYSSLPGSGILLDRYKGSCYLR